jgi:hypothetical protein
VQIAASLKACRGPRQIGSIVLISSSIARQKINRRHVDAFKVWPSQ